MHRIMRAGLLLALLLILLANPTTPPAPVAAAAPSDCSPTGHLITGPTLNRDPAWTDSALWAVAAAGPADVWAVGSYTAYDPKSRQLAPSALIEHWTGTTWQRVPHPAESSPRYLAAALYGLAVVNPQDIWTVGTGYGTAATSWPIVEHWNGAAWTSITLPTGSDGAGLRHVAASGPADVWVTGGDGTPSMPFHWDGRAWQPAPVPLPAGAAGVWAGLVAFAPGDAWLAGTLYDLARGGDPVGVVLAHWDGVAWTVQPTTGLLPARTALTAAAASGPRDLWVAGNVNPLPGPVPTALPAALTPIGGAFPSGPVFAHWDGSRWSRVAAPAGYYLQSLAFAGPGDGWAGGIDGRVDGQRVGLLHWDGSAWTPVAVSGRDEPFAYPDYLPALAVEGKDDFWAVGAGHLPGPTPHQRLSVLHIFRDCAVPTTPAPDPQDPAVSYFPPTGHSLRGLFRDYWTAHGGLAQFGYPLTDEFPERNPADGRIYTVQYFERNRFELHPENAGTPYMVLLGLLGRNVTPAPQYAGAFAPLRSGPPGVRFFPATGHSLAPAFRAYWEQHGGLAVYGYPISEPFTETSATDGKDYLVQYFERNRLELHPELPADYRVSLGLLGVDLLRSRGWLPPGPAQ